MILNLASKPLKMYVFVSNSEIILFFYYLNTDITGI